MDRAGRVVRQMLPDDTNCFYFHPKTGPPGLAFMVVDGRVARVDVDEKCPIATDRGAKIGDTEAAIRRLYPGRVRVTRHEYVDGHYLTVVPKERRYRGYRIVFETDGKRVTSYRAGK